MTSPVALRDLPSVDRLLRAPGAEAMANAFGRPLATEALRVTLDETRRRLREGSSDETIPPDHDLVSEARDWLEELLAPTLRPVINATGVIIHTNLGRAPLSDDAIAAVAAVAAGYSTLEYDTATGRRGSRAVHVESLLTRLTGAEAALVVNNNAAAVLLMLSVLGRDREVIISRGQLVEIGGGFRIPEILKTSGARLVEVGTTNRTHLVDYEGAIGQSTALLLRVHSSNFRQIGFTAAVSLADLVALGKAHGIPVVDDLGSGTLLDTTQFGLGYEPRVQDSIQAGATLVTFSGDKLLGGPQAGLIVGTKQAVDQLRSYPLTRALRVDKTTLAGLSATLSHYLRGEAVWAIPIWRMIAAQPERLAERSRRWAARLDAAGFPAAVKSGRSTIGGGSLPEETLPTMLLVLPGLPADALAARLRKGHPAVVARIVEDAVCFDPRTVQPDQDDALLGAIMAAAEGLR